MDPDRLRQRLVAHLDALVVQIGARPAGSPANRRATDYVRSVLSAAGLPVQALPFCTRWWQPGDGRMELVDGTVIGVAPNPFSATGEVEGEVVRVESREDLDRPGLDVRGRMLVLGASIGGEPVMPRAFPFFRPDDHRRLIDFLDHNGPAAVIAASDRHACMPTFEDPDLGLPSTTVAPTTAARLRTGDRVRLRLEGTTRSGRGVNVSTRVGGATGRVVVSAHIDAKVTTPGAFDNAASVAVLLALAESGTDHLGPTELVFFNGEDHYDACGEQAWLASTDLDEVVLNINLDGAGVAGRPNGLASIGCPPPLDRLLDQHLTEHLDWTRMPAWFESDHAIFAMRGIPAVAITSAGVHDLFTTVAHTPADRLDLVDVAILAGIVDVLRTLVPQAHAALTPSVAS